MVLKGNYVGVDDKKEYLHAKRWNVYMNEKKNIIQSGYSVEVVGYDGKNFHWGVVYDHVIEDETDHDAIGLRGVVFGFFDEDDKVVGRESSS